MKTSRVLMIILTGLCLVSCASAPTNHNGACSELISPNSNEIYFFVSNEDSSLEKIVQVLEKNTAYAFLQRNHDLQIVSDLKDVGSEGVLIQVDALGVTRGTISKRVAILYQAINLETNDVMIKDNVAIGSIRGYNKVTVGLGKVIATKVSNLMSCFEIRKKNL